MPSGKARLFEQLEVLPAGGRSAESYAQLAARWV